MSPLEKIRKKRILVVDDEKPFARFVKTALEETGFYEVLEEGEADRVLVTAKAFKPDLIFMDIQMPRLDGSEAAARLKQHEDLKDIPIIFLTGAVSRDEVDDSGGIIGGQTFLAKPVKVKELVAAVERRLGPPDPFQI